MGFYNTQCSSLEWTACDAATSGNFHESVADLVFLRGDLAMHIAHNGEVPRGEKMLYSGTDPESYITEYTLVYEDLN